MRVLPAAALVAAAFVLLGPAASSVRTQSPSIGIGIMGDSDSDEYRADDGRGGAYGDTTLNWMELLARYRGVNFGAWGTRDFPRRTGYAYNWALSGSRAADVVGGGQAAGLAQQIAGGDVQIAFLMIGVNDFAVWNGTYQDVYDGTVSGAALTAKIDAIVASITAALDIVQSAGPVELFIAPLVDRANPAEYPDAARRQVVTNAINAVNYALVPIVASRGVHVIDPGSALQAMLERVDAAGNLMVGGELITFATMGDEPHHARLSDRHAGTVISGLMANVVSDAFNTAGAGIAPFTDEEILGYAGIVHDRTPPAVAITAPADGAVVSGSLAIAAVASDDTGVVGVRFLVDGIALGTEDTTAPYSRTWTVSGIGSHVLTAIARDLAGNTATTSVTVTSMTDTTAPSVAIANPAAGATLWSTISVTANASDNVAVAGVRFKVDGMNLGSEDLTAPFSVSWNAGTASAGVHTLSATARDAAGNTASSSVTVTVVPATTTLSPSSAAVTTGSLQSGGLPSFTADDNNYFVAGSTSGFPSRTSTEIGFPGSSGSASSLSVSTTLKSSRASTSVTLEIFNFVTGAWQALSSFTVGTGETTQTATIASNVGNYRGAGNAIRLRISSRGTLATHVLSIDRVRVTVAR